MLASQQRNPIAIAVDSASVYWLTRDGGEVMRCAKRGCDQKPTVLASGIQGLARLAVDASSVYFTAGDKVLKVPK